jgi:hypothetical protein
MTKSVSNLIVSGQLLLVVKNVKDRSIFGVFDLAEGRLRFTQTIPYVRASVWSLSESMGLVACVGWEDGMMSTFDTTDGTVKNGFRTVQNADVLLYEATIRICEKSTVHVFDFQGNKLAIYRFAGECGKDWGKFIISKKGNHYELQNDRGEHLNGFVSNGLGITSVAILSRGLVIAESRRPITLFNETGGIIWQKQSPKEHHPTDVAVGSDDKIYAIHTYLPTLDRSIHTVQQPDGLIVAQKEIDISPSVCTFSTSLSGWITGSFKTFEYKDGKFIQGRLESLKSAFEIED